MYTDTSVKSKLIISKVNAADSGRYVCVAENSLGKHEAAMELEIKGMLKKKSTPNRYAQYMYIYILSSRFTAGRSVLQRHHSQQRTTAMDRLEREQLDERLRTGIRAHLFESSAARRFDQ